MLLLLPRPVEFRLDPTSSSRRKFCLQNTPRSIVATATSIPMSFLVEPRQILLGSSQPLKESRIHSHLPDGALHGSLTKAEQRQQRKMPMRAPDGGPRGASHVFQTRYRHLFEIGNALPIWNAVAAGLTLAAKQVSGKRWVPERLNERRLRCCMTERDNGTSALKRHHDAGEHDLIGTTWAFPRRQIERR